MDEQILYKAFQASPDAILISNLRDGRFVEVNDGFTRLSGYTRQEALSSSSIQLGMWANLKERDAVVSDLRQDQRVADREVDFRIKSGKILRCRLFGEIIRLREEEHVLWVVQDISERSLVDQILRLRLSLWEYGATHSLHELMQRTLDEIEEITDSLISFYHFVNEDQNSLSLQAWSTRTQAEFCRAVGAGMHYPIQQAGVWVDCVSQHKPVIHNDYANLPHRKGLPEGHAAVIRELVVPTIRNGKIVGILGVGNKAYDYDQQDVEQVSHIADLVWEIVEHKRAVERIHELNSQLEYLAMTDDLTGLANRRAFFIQGANEIKKARRYGTPLSLLMLDVDEFKTVNDRYGHEMGDFVLQSLVRAMLENVRETDMVVRMGGEEFSILLPNTRAKDAFMLAERIRLAIEAITYPVTDGLLQVTVSIGVTAYKQKMVDIDALLRIADAAMYQAKGEGRNQVVLKKGFSRDE